MSESTPASAPEATGPIEHIHSGEVDHSGQVRHSGTVEHQHIAPKPDYGLFNRIALALTIAAAGVGIGTVLVQEEGNKNALKREAIAAATAGKSTFNHLGLLGNPTTYAVEVDHSEPSVKGMCVAKVRKMAVDISVTTGLPTGVSVAAEEAYPAMPVEPKGVAADSPAMKAYNDAKISWDNKKEDVDAGRVVVVVPCHPTTVHLSHTASRKSSHKTETVKKKRPASIKTATPTSTEADKATEKFFAPTPNKGPNVLVVPLIPDDGSGDVQPAPPFAAYPSDRTRVRVAINLTA